MRFQITPKTKRRFRLAFKKKVPLPYRVVLGLVGPRRKQLEEASERIFRKLNSFVREGLASSKERHDSAFLARLYVEARQKCDKLVFDYAAFEAAKSAMDALRVKADRDKVFEKTRVLLEKALPKIDAVLFGRQPAKGIIDLESTGELGGYIFPANTRRFCDRLVRNFVLIRNAVNDHVIAMEAALPDGFGIPLPEQSANSAGVNRKKRKRSGVNGFKR